LSQSLTFFCRLIKVKRQKKKGKPDWIPFSSQKKKNLEEEEEEEEL